MEVINALLNDREQISLREIEDSFFIRRDIKFVAQDDLLEPVIRGLNKNWKVLDVNGKYNQYYHSIYFDTESLQCYRDHHNQRKNRKKFRFRSYGDTNTLFFEIKTKTNKGITAKQRIRVNDTNMSTLVSSFIEVQSNFNAEDLKPVLEVDYNRITLINEITDEKITIDTSMKVSSNNVARSFPNIMILELKQDYFNRHLDTKRWIQEMHLNATSMSKYCLGIMNCVSGVKTNRFKQKNRLIEKIVKAS